ncbi:oligosaccharide flippase family protein [Flavobacteriaceae bacterium]|nr:oligosaccharide flippase family protein [Flavobacteriaceae bacterium]|tara:strand:- start:512 stop:1888 length:1377 start_codon:yes stop_codon:yes gene_type:complete
MNVTFKKRFGDTFKNLNWSLISSLLAAIISFGSNVYYLRTFGPDQFGSIAIGYLILAFALPFSEFGIVGALIQRNKKDFKIEIAQTLSLFISIVLGLCCMFFFMFFNQFTIKDPLAFSIIIFFTLVFTSLLLIYKTYFSIEMNYHILSKIVILSTLISHTITILIIYLFDNSNILILFNQRLLLPLISLILFCNYSKIKWRFSYSFMNLISEIKFGINLMFANVLESVYKQGIPVLFSSKSLIVGGLFFQATKLLEMVNGFMFNVSNTILFSFFIKEKKNDKERISQLFILFFLIITSLLILIFSSFGEAIMIYLFGEDWSGINSIFCLLLIMNSNNILDSSVRVDLKSNKYGKSIFFIEVLKKLIIIIYLLNFTFFNNISNFIIGLILCGSLGTILSIIFTKDKIIFSDYIYKYLLIQIFIIINLFSITYNAYIISYMLLAGLIIYFTNKILRFENH